MSWITDEQAIGLWADAENLEPDVLQLLLASAYEDCVAFLPELPEGEDYEDKPTPNRVLAQLYQAKSRYNALLAGNDGQIGAGENTITLFPLDWQVKQLLRPKRGRPTFG
ncbi:hypothetical protein [Promicromonospora kroppenstedtii]|uniref:hypothetical protein n=1 Tax=Promicromonospora kroppenstedtii TaxID=440482 RepID=UPI000564D31E|nr:hypothetical protein [Promicromonospora kroppenstedtii]